MSQEMMAKSNKLGYLSLLISCMVIFWVAFYPGFMSSDSIAQFEVSKSLKFNDWHPPLMSWVWSVMGFFFPGPSGMLALHIILVWMSVYVWWNNYRERSRAWLFFLIPFLPWVLNFAGVLWKDVGLAFTLFMLSGLTLKSPSRRNTLLAAILVFYASNLRYNAIFALFPVLVLLSYRWLKKPTLLKSLVMSSLIIFLTVYSGSVINYAVLGAEKTRPSTYMMVDDLAYLSIRYNESFIPGVQIDEIKECAAVEVGQNKLVGRIFCLSDQPSYKRNGSLSSEIGSIWLSKVIKYPIEYLKFRMAAFSYLLRTPADAPYYFWHQGIDENSIGLKNTPNGLTLIAEKFVKRSAVLVPSLFKPYWWLLFSLQLLVFTCILVPTRTVLIARVLLASSVAYIVGYFPVTPMADFRYVYWSVIAASLSVVVLVVDWPGWGISIRRIVVVLLASIICDAIIWNHYRLGEVNIDHVLNDSLPGERVTLDSAPSLLSDVKKDGGLYIISGPDPYIAYDVASLNLAAKDAGWLKFDFSCVDSAATPELQLFWWGDNQVNASEAQSVNRKLVEGINLVPIAHHLRVSGIDLLRGIRFDLSNPTACRAIYIGSIQFVKRVT